MSTEGNDDGAIQENLIVNNVRQSKKGIVDAIRCLTFDTPPSMDPFNPSPEYMEYLKNSKDKMDSVLEGEYLFIYSLIIVDI